MQMKTVTVTTNKGGVGKTTVIKSLGKAATDAGFNVLILDLDSQRNATSWGKRRQKEEIFFPLVRAVDEQELKDELQRAAKAGCDLVLIDTPPGKNSESLAAMEEADIVIIPFWNDQDSYEGVSRTSKTARRLGKPAYGLLNFATPNSLSHEVTAAGVLKGLDLPMVPVVLHRYDVHRQANAAAKTAQELEPDSIPADQVRRLWEWLDKIVQSCTIAQVQKGAA